MVEKIEKGRFKVLLIEDDISYAAILAKRLSTLDYPSFHVEHATRLQQGFEILGKEGIDVVLLDLGLPESTSIETLLKVQSHVPEIPIVVLTGLDDRTLGIEAVRRGAQDFCVKGKTNGKTLAHVLRYAIERNQLQSSLRNLSLTDELTGLHNRRGFLILAEQQIKFSRRTRKGLLLVFIDVDDLKQINDAFGHREGDQALIDLAQILKVTFRESDILARLGGDEFAVLATDVRSDHGPITFARIERKLNFHNAQENHKYKLSVSTGFTYFDPINPCSVQELIAQADEAMYAQKIAKKFSPSTESSVPVYQEKEKNQIREVQVKKNRATSKNRKKILIIEDDQSIQKFLGYRLKKLGFEVIAARDGKEGLEEATKQVPNLIILDLMLPEFSGEEVCKAIREDEDEKFSAIPIIMLTAKAGDADRIIGKVIGANSYMTKPFSAKELLAEVNRLMKE